jgi:hypothetical protein
MVLFSEKIRGFSLLHNNQTETKFHPVFYRVVNGGFPGDKAAGS